MTERPNHVAVALLTQADLDLLGSGFRSAIPVEDATGFDDLLKAIDTAERRSFAQHRL